MSVVSGVVPTCSDKLDQGLPTKHSTIVRFTHSIRPPSNLLVAVFHRCLVLLLNTLLKKSSLITRSAIDRMLGLRAARRCAFDAATALFTARSFASASLSARQQVVVPLSALDPDHEKNSSHREAALKDLLQACRGGVDSLTERARLFIGPTFSLVSGPTQHFLLCIAQVHSSPNFPRMSLRIS